MNRGGNILFSGVGGQGILLASELTAQAVLAAGFDAKKSEVHGMAQRGGSVEAHLRYGKKVYSPLIEPGKADILVAFEMMEAARYLPFLHRGSVAVVNTQKIPPPSVALGQSRYPEKHSGRTVVRRPQGDSCGRLCRGPAGGRAEKRQRGHGGRAVDLSGAGRRYFS